MEGNGSCLFEGTALAFAWREDNHEKAQSGRSVALQRKMKKPAS
jgi:hypothetical protein